MSIDGPAQQLKSDSKLLLTRNRGILLTMSMKFWTFESKRMKAFHPLKIGKQFIKLALGDANWFRNFFVSLSRAVQYHCRMLSCNKPFRFQFGYVSSNSKKKEEIFNRLVQNLLNHFVQSLETKCALLIYSELNELHTPSPTHLGTWNYREQGRTICHPGDKGTAM
jgi:hypothetical protein